MELFKAESKKYEKEFLKLLEQWVSIPSFYDRKTVSKDMPFGKGVYDALNWFENLGRENNFKVKNIDNHAVQIEYGNGKEYVDIFGHCDVVNPGEGWDSEPFKLNIIGDKLVARGVSDNKGPMIVNFLALKMIKDLDINLKRKVRLIAGGNVENVSMAYIIRDHCKEKFENRKSIMIENIEKINKKYDNRVELDLKDSYYNMKEKIEPVMFIVDIAKEAMEELGIKPRLVPVRGGTDGARLSFNGLPCPNIFTGGLNFHGKNECIPVSSMEKATKLIVRIAEKYAERV